MTTKTKASVLAKAIKSIDPVVKQKVDNRMYLAARIEDLLKGKGMRRNDLAKKMGKRPSEITKWLSGSHNFTIDTLTEIGIALEVNLIVQTKQSQRAQSINVVFHVTKKVVAVPFSYGINLHKVTTKEYTA